MECRDRFFQFGEQNVDRSGDRFFLLSMLWNLIESISGERL